MPKPVSKTLSMKQLIETIKQPVVFLLLHKTLFSKRFEINQLLDSNYPEHTQLCYKQPPSNPWRFGVIKTLLQQSPLFDEEKSLVSYGEYATTFLGYPISL